MTTLESLRAAMMRSDRDTKMNQLNDTKMNQLNDTQIISDDISQLLALAENPAGIISAHEMQKLTRNADLWRDLSKAEAFAKLTEDYHGNETAFRIGDEVQYVAYDGTVVPGKIVAIDGLFVEIQFDYGHRGWESALTIFKQN